MAIQKEITSRHGITASEAYHWVETVYTDREKKRDDTTVRVKIYSTKDAKTSGKDPLERVEFIFSLSTEDTAENAVKQAYVALKKLDDVGGREII